MRSSDVERAFDAYHAACVIDGRRDGMSAFWSEHVPGCIFDASPELLRAHAEAFIAGCQPECHEAMEQHDASECIPEIAVQRWFEGFSAGVRASVEEFIANYR